MKLNLIKNLITLKGEPTHEKLNINLAEAKILDKIEKLEF